MTDSISLSNSLIGYLIRLIKFTLSMDFLNETNHLLHIEAPKNMSQNPCHFRFTIILVSSDTKIMSKVSNQTEMNFYTLKYGTPIKERCQNPGECSVGVHMNYSIKWVCSWVAALKYLSTNKSMKDLF